MGDSVRSTQLREGLDLGVARVVVGTSAVLDPAFVPAAIAEAGPPGSPWAWMRAMGWSRCEGGRRRPPSARRTWSGGCAADGVETVIYTDVSRDGMLQGADVSGALALQRAGTRVIASGGVSSLADVRAVRDAGLAGAIIGRALYEGRFDLAEALEAARCASPS